MKKTIVQEHSKNFDTLRKAFSANQVCLMDCIEKATGEHVAILCATWVDEQGMHNFTPFAKFFNGNPFELLISPIEYELQKKNKVA